MPEDRHVRPFAEFLHEQRAGGLHAEMSAAMNELVEAVHQYGKAGTLVLTLKLKPATKGGSHTLIVSDDVTVKKPVGDRSESIFYADDDGNLSRRDPRQPEIPGLREVPPPATAAGTSNAQEA